MPRFTRLLLPLFGAAVLAVAAAAPAGAEGRDAGDGSPVYIMTAQGPTVLEHARAAQLRDDGAISIRLHTHGLVPGTTPVIWLAVFNTPQGCSPSGAPIAICDPSNLGNPAATPSLIQLTGSTVTPSGHFSFHTRLHVGDTSNALMGPGLTKLHRAEVQVVVRDGSVIEFAVLDPGQDEHAG